MYEGVTLNSVALMSGQLPKHLSLMISENWLLAVNSQGIFLLVVMIKRSLVKRIIMFKDSAYFCYCACVLCISRYSGFLWVVLTNTGIFLRGLKLCGESRT